MAKIMTSNRNRIGILALAGLAAILVAAPTAVAQGAVTFEVKTPSLDPTTIQPDIGSATLEVPWKVASSSPTQTPITVVQQNLQIGWDFDCGSQQNNVLISGSRSTVVTFENPSGPSFIAEDEAAFTVAVTQEAPGETQIECKVTGTLTDLNSQTAPAPAPQSATFKVTPGYLGLIAVNVPKTIKTAGPQKEMTYDLEISNLGNARSNIVFKQVSETASGWNPVIPAQIPLESKSQGGTETAKTVGFTVSTPFKNGWNNKQTTFQLEVQPVSTKDPNTVGASVQVSVLARVRGVYVPAVEPILMLGAVLGAALVVRLARDK